MPKRAGVWWEAGAKGSMNGFSSCEEEMLRRLSHVTGISGLFVLPNSQ